MEDTLVSGFCTYCGRQIINDKAVVGNVNVKLDRTPEIVNTLKLAKYSMYDKDANGARVLLSKAMQMSSEYSDVWYMDAVLDKRNAKADMERARQYPSLGIFTESDVSVYKNFDDSGGQALLIFSIMIAFFGIFISLPIGIIFEVYYLILAMFIIGIALVAVSIIYVKKHKSNIPAPVFEDEDNKAKQAALDETNRRLGSEKRP